MKRKNRVFLMDGDALIVPQKRLAWILDQIREHIPRVEKVGSYANAKSIKMKSLEELIELKRKGLGIFYLGVETGDDEILKKVCKGSNTQTLIKMGRKVREAGIKLSVTVLLGIAGRDGSLKHARLTGELLSAMDPNYVGALTVMLRSGTPLHREYVNGEFELLTEKELLPELREMLAHTNLSRGLFFSNHASNYFSVQGRLPHDRQSLLDQLDRVLENRDVSQLRPESQRGL